MRWYSSGVRPWEAMTSGVICMHRDCKGEGGLAARQRSPGDAPAECPVQFSSAGPQTRPRTGKSACPPLKLPRRTARTFAVRRPRRLERVELHLLVGGQRRDQRGVERVVRRLDLVADLLRRDHEVADRRGVGRRRRQRLLDLLVQRALLLVQRLRGGLEVAARGLPRALLRVRELQVIGERIAARRRRRPRLWGGGGGDGGDEGDEDESSFHV